jgi:CO/xanthine dehydrogenase Mo-binding subunit
VGDGGRDLAGGIGIANYVEITSGAPRERTEITVLAEGKVELVMGTMSSGQGHETSFAQLVTEWLGVPFESVSYFAHDTDRVAAGGDSHSGRSMKLATTIIGKATDDIIDKGAKSPASCSRLAKWTVPSRSTAKRYGRLPTSQEVKPFTEHVSLLRLRLRLRL